MNGLLRFCHQMFMQFNCDLQMLLLYSGRKQVGVFLHEMSGQKCVWN